MSARSYWYVVAESEELEARRAVSRELFGEWLALFRDEEGRAVAFQDRCAHRGGRLSKGKVANGCLRCPYHGWRYDGDGTVSDVPAEGPRFRVLPTRRAKTHETRERDGYVYVRLDADHDAPEAPSMPGEGAPGWRTLRLRHDFESTVEDCAENFIDIPHTVAVHPGIFRVARAQRIDARVHREGGRVEVEYRGETDNLGVFARFLNPRGRAVTHRDRFVAPNLTQVHYDMGPRRELFITSQSVPLAEGRVRVFTHLAWDYGRLTAVATPIIVAQAKAIIAQDVAVLRDQRRVLERYGRRFMDSEHDRIHAHVRAIREAIEAGRDPAELPPRTEQIRFWV